MNEWLDPITATSGSAFQRYITGTTKESIENIEDIYSTSYYSLKYTGFNPTKSKDPYSTATIIRYFDHVFKFKDVWFGVDGQGTNQSKLFYI